MPREFSIDVSQSGTTARVGLTGELDLWSAPHLTAHMATLERSADVDAIVVDAQHLTFLDVSGLRAFIRADRAARHSAHAFRIEPRSRCVDRMLELCGMPNRFL